MAMAELKEMKPAIRNSLRYLKISLEAYLVLTGSTKRLTLKLPVLDGIKLSNSTL